MAKNILTPLSRQSAPFIRKRLAALRALVRKQKLDALLLTHITNLRYMSGFTGTTAMMVVAPTKSWFFSDFRYREQMKSEVAGSSCIEVARGYFQNVAEFLISHKFSRVGVEAKHMSLDERAAFGKMFRGSGVRLTADTGSVEALRLYKDKHEVSLIRKALKIACSALDDVLSFVKPGLRESELAAELEHRMRVHGGDGISFTTIVGSGARSAMPHGVASDKKVRKGEFIVFDFGTLFRGYCSDTTRTVHLGLPSPEHKKIYRSVYEAQERAIEKAALGMPMKAVDALARDAIKNDGYGKYFGHGLGHGLGLDVHEAPTVSPQGKGRVEHGMVFTIEPGVYVPTTGGVRIEDVVAVTQKGKIELLTKYPKEMIVL